MRKTPGGCHGASRRARARGSSRKPRHAFDTNGEITVYLPLHERDHRHDDGTGWNGAIALLVVLGVIGVGHAAATAASPLHTANSTCTPGRQVDRRRSRARVLRSGEGFGQGGIGDLRIRRRGLPEATPLQRQRRHALVRPRRQGAVLRALAAARAGRYLHGQAGHPQLHRRNAAHRAGDAPATRVVLRAGLRSGTFAGSDLLGKTVTGSFSC